MAETSIEWVKNADGTQGRTWNPVRGCSRISPGCVNCYAERIAARFSGVDYDTSECDEHTGSVSKPQAFHLFAERKPQPHWTGKVELIESMLHIPLRTRKPTTWFVNSMSDLFHEALSFENIDQIFTVMVAAPKHTYQILTKRAKRMHSYFHSGRHDNGNGPDRANYHLGQNIWLGVSCENQQYADERIPWLLNTPAAVRFISAEPLLGPIDFTRIDHESAKPYSGAYWINALCGDGFAPSPLTDLPIELWCDRIDQIIVGSESGPGARPMDEAWVRTIRDQCQAAGTAFFYKQRLDSRGHKLSLPELDGRQWAEIPEVLA